MQNMPLFGLKKFSELETNCESEDATNGNHSPSPSTSPNAANPTTMVQKLSFGCQLAHGSPTEYVSNFASIKQLYEKIGDSFHMDVSEILFCTLNTYKLDMDHLLGGRLGLQDFIFVHCKGDYKEIEVTKNDNFLGLTITDNGSGYSFIKKIKDGSLMDKIKFVEVGDVIERINEKNLMGCRHFEVAKALKDIPVGETFTLRLIEPCKVGFSQIATRTGNNSKKVNYGTGKETLKLRHDGPALVEELPSDSEARAIEKINRLLESFMGIHDSELSTQIWNLGKTEDNPHAFTIAIFRSDLAMFDFSDDFIFDLWGAIIDAKKQ